MQKYDIGSYAEADHDGQLEATMARYFLEQNQRHCQRRRAAAQREAKRRQELAEEARLEAEAMESQRGLEMELNSRLAHNRRSSHLTSSRSIHAAPGVLVDRAKTDGCLLSGDNESSSSSSGVLSEEELQDDPSGVPRFSGPGRIVPSPRTSKSNRSGAVERLNSGNPQSKTRSSKIGATAQRRMQKLTQHRKSRHHEKEWNLNFGKSLSLSAKDQQLTHARRKSICASLSRGCQEKVPYKFIGGKPVTAVEAVLNRAKKVFFATINPPADLNSYKILGDDVPDALWDLGLVPRSQAERRAVSLFLESVELGERLFSFKEFIEVTQNARERVMDVQQLALEKHFTETHGSARQSVALTFESTKTMEVLHQLGCAILAEDSAVMEEIRRDFNSCPRAEEGDEFDQFHALIQHAQERLAEVIFTEKQTIMMDTGLSRFLARDFKRELPELYAQYRSRQMDVVQASGMRLSRIDLRGVLNILGDFGILPITENRERDVTKVIFEAKASSPNARNHPVHRDTTAVTEQGNHVDEALLFDFSEFLLTVKHLRKINTGLRQRDLQPLFDKYARNHRNSLDLRGACSVLAEVGLTPRNREQQEIIGELFRDLDANGTGTICFTELTQLIGRIYEWKERRSRGHLKSYATSIGLDAECFQDYVSAFQELDNSDCNALGQRTIKRLLTNVGKKLTSEEFSELYERLDNNFSNILELPEFLRLLAFLERDREQAKIEPVKSKKELKNQMWDLLPPSYEDFMASKNIEQ